MSRSVARINHAHEKRRENKHRDDSISEVSKEIEALTQARKENQHTHTQPYHTHSGANHTHPKAATLLLYVHIHATPNTAWYAWRFLNRYRT